VRHHHAHAARAFAGDLDHVGDEGVVALGLGRQAAVVAVEGIGLGLLDAPLLQREGRIGHHDVELHELVVLDQARVAQRVAPLDAKAVHTVQEHVHAA